MTSLKLLEVLGLPQRAGRKWWRPRTRSRCCLDFLNRRKDGELLAFPAVIVLPTMATSPGLRRSRFQAYGTKQRISKQEPVLLEKYFEHFSCHHQRIQICCSPRSFLIIPWWRISTTYLNF